jgi:tRNA/rRNA methyltransferase
MEEKIDLDSISVVLVRPKYYENIGSVARAMKNMGLNRLVIVDGPSPLHPNAYRLASGAEDILERAEEAPTLRDGIEDMGCVVGMTRRQGKGRRPLLSPEALVRRLISLSVKNSIGLVFGSERIGLTNEELSHCHLYGRIPSAESFPSLNLAQAVMVITYELFKASVPAVTHPVEVVQTEQLEKLFDHMEETLLKIGFLSPNDPKRVMRVLKQLFGRSGMDEREVRILQGILSKMDWYVGKREKGGGGR